jgi:hypothetical protein
VIAHGERAVLVELALDGEREDFAEASWRDSLRNSPTATLWMSPGTFSC